MSLILILYCAVTPKGNLRQEQVNQCNATPSLTRCPLALCLQ